MTLHFITLLSILFLVFADATHKRSFHNENPHKNAPQSITKLVPYGNVNFGSDPTLLSASEVELVMKRRRIEYLAAVLKNTRQHPNSNANTNGGNQLISNIGPLPRNMLIQKLTKVPIDSEESFTHLFTSVVLQIPSLQEVSELTCLLIYFDQPVAKIESRLFVFTRKIIANWRFLNHNIGMKSWYERFIESVQNHVCMLVTIKCIVKNSVQPLTDEVQFQLIDPSQISKMEQLAALPQRMVSPSPKFNLGTNK